MTLTAEAASLRFQHRLFYRELGSLFPTMLSPSSISQVLDLSCGPGTWMLEVAQVYPHMYCVGVDQKAALIQSASEDANLIGATNVAFRGVESYAQLPYPDETFDVVHIQRSSAAITPRQWPRALTEIARVLRPGGWLHFLDFEIGPTSSSAVNAFIKYVYAAHKKDERVFSPESQALTSAVVLPRLLTRVGYEDVRYTLHAIDIGNQADSPGRDYILAVLAEDKHIADYLVKAGVVTQHEIERIIASMYRDARQLKYCAAGMLISVVGMKRHP